MVLSPSSKVILVLQFSQQFDGHIKVKLLKFLGYLMWYAVFTHVLKGLIKFGLEALRKVQYSVLFHYSLVRTAFVFNSLGIFGFEAFSRRYDCPSGLGYLPIPHRGYDYLH